MSEHQLIDTQLAESVRRAARSRRSDLAYGAIRQSISVGDIKPGAWLRQEALAGELGVSQVTIREALSRLVAEGLAVDVPYKGVKTVLLPSEELPDIYDLRILLEGFALECAVHQMSPEDLGWMRELLPGTVADVDPDTAEVARQANREFHLVPARATGRRHLMRFVEQLLDLTNPYALLGERTAQERLSIAAGELDDHTQILQALEAGDGPLAREALERHLRKALRVLRSLMQGSGVPADLQRH
jgi:DNA-binding GntR family transcriptional regulator